MYNKRQFSKQNEQKVLHKIGKNWVVVSLSLLAALGAGGLVTAESHESHASSVTTPDVQPKQVAQIGNKANVIHKQLMANQVGQNNTGANNTYRPKLYTLRNPSSNGNIPRGMDGVWGNAYYTFNKDTGHLTVFGNDWNSKQNIAINGGLNTISAVRIPNSLLKTRQQYTSDMNHYLSNDLHHNVRPSDIRSITVNSDGLVQLPNNSSYLFADLPNLTQVDLTDLHISSDKGNANVISSTSHMFANDPKLQTVILGESIDTSDISDMSSMFSDDPQLTTIDSINFDTKHANNLSSMFANDEHLSAINMSLNANPNTNVQEMFANDQALKSLNLSNFNVDDSTQMSDMLKGTSNLHSLTLGDNTKLSSDVGLANSWYKKDAADDYTANSSTKLTNGQSKPGTYVDQEHINIHPDNSIINGIWPNTDTPYSFDKRTGILRTTGDGMIQNVDILKESIKVNDIREIDITGHNNTIYGNATADFYNLPHLKKVDLSGLNTTGMTSTASMFQNDPELTEIDFGDHFNTSDVTDMSGMFASDASLQNVDLSHFNTSNLQNVQAMFDHDSNLQSLDLSHFNADKITNMSYMFNKDQALKSITFGNQFTTSDVSDMSFMFNDDSALLTLDLSNFNTQNVIDMSTMFQNDTSLKSINFGDHFDTPKVTDLSFMFTDDKALTSLNLANFDTHKISTENMSCMFEGVAHLSGLTLGPNTLIPSSTKLSKSIWYLQEPQGIEHIKTPPYTEHYTYNDPVKIIDNDAQNAGTFVLKRVVDPAHENDDNVTGVWGSAPYEFNPLTGLLQTIGAGTIAPINTLSIDSSQIKKIQFAPGTEAPKDSSNLFAATETPKATSDGMMINVSSLANLSDIDCSNLDTSNVTNMNSMFLNDTGLTHLNLSNFNTNNVSGLVSSKVDGPSATYKYDNGMFAMFENDYNLKSLDLSSFNTSNVHGMNAMFYNDYSLKALNLGQHFNTSNVMSATGMFKGDHSLKNLELGNEFYTTLMERSGASMSDMFHDDYDLVHLNLGSNFNTDGIKNMANMFSSDLSLKSLDLGSHFDTSTVSDMHDMFANDDNLQTLNLGDYFTTSHAEAHTYPIEVDVKNSDGQYVSAQAHHYDEPGHPILESYNGASDIFGNDKLLSTISGQKMKLTISVNLPKASGQSWFLQNNDGQPVGNVIDLTNGASYSGTYGLYVYNTVDHTKLQFMDGTKNIGNLIVTGYDKAPIPYAVLVNSLGDGYSLNIPIKTLIKSIPNSSYYYSDGIVNVPVKYDGHTKGGQPVSASFVTLVGNIKLNFLDHNGNRISKSLEIPYQIDGVPTGSTIDNLLLHGDPAVSKPTDYLGKMIQSFAINNYSYLSQNSSKLSDYQNVLVTVNDGRDSDGNYVNGKKIMRNLTFNFESGLVNEHVVYQYNGTQEGSDDVLGQPGAKGNDDNADGLTPGFIIIPGTKTSFVFTNHGSMTIPVEPEQVDVPFKIVNSDDQVIPGFSDLKSVNRLSINKSEQIMLNPNDSAALSNKWYQLDSNQCFSISKDQINLANNSYDGKILILHAHKIMITVPVHFMFNGQLKGTGKLTGTMNETISDLKAKLASEIPAGYQIVANSLNHYSIENANKISQDNYQTSPLNIMIQPTSAADTIIFEDQNGHKISTISKSGKFDDSFNIGSLVAPKGYQITSTGTLSYDDQSHVVTVVPDGGIKVPFQLVDGKTGKVIVVAQQANGNFTVNQPEIIHIANTLIPTGYQLNPKNDYSFVVTPSDENHGQYTGKPLSFKIDLINYRLPVIYEYQNSIDGDLTIDRTTTVNVNDHFDLNNYIKSNCPDNYKLTAELHYNGWQLLKNLPTSGTVLKQIVVPIKPVQKSAWVVYKDGDQAITKPVNLGYGDDANLDLGSSHFMIGVHPNTLPSGYQVVNPDQLIQYNDQSQAVAVEPVQESDVINYYYDGHQVNSDNSTNRVVGNEYAGNVQFKLSSLKVPAGYQLSANNFQTSYRYNGQPVNVKVVPKMMATTISFSYNGQSFPTVTKYGLGNQLFNTDTLSLPNGYQLAKGNQVEPYNKSHVVVSVVPKQMPNTGDGIEPLKPVIPQSTSQFNSKVVNNKPALSSFEEEAAKSTSVAKSNANSVKPKQVTNRGYVIQHNVNTNHDVINYYGRKHVVHYHNNGKNTIQVKVHNHYRTVVVSTSLPTNNVSGDLIQVVNHVNFTKPAKRVWSWKSMNHALNKIQVGEVVSHHGYKLARVQIPGHNHYLIVGKSSLAHKFINRVGLASDKQVLHLRQGFKFRISRIIVFHGKHGNYVRYEFKYHNHNYWVTARKDYVQGAYLQVNDLRAHHNWIKVTRACRVYARTKNGRFKVVRYVRPGAYLHVKKVVSIGNEYNHQTRLLMTNGEYITANKGFVRVVK